MSTDHHVVAASPDLVAHRVREVLREPAATRGGGVVAIGVRARPDWTYGPLVVDGHDVAVRPCVSPLAMRAALQEPGERDAGLQVLVLLADLDERELSEDIRARLVKRRLIALNPWDAVKDRFGAKRLDPSLGDADHAWLASALLEVPVDPTAPRLSGLSIDTAVDLVARHVLRLDHLSAEQLLLATTDAARMARLLSQPEPARDGLLRALAYRMGAVGGLIVGAVGLGHAADALPLALAARAAVADAEGSYAQARIEALTGVSSPSGAALSAYAEVGERCAVVLRQSNRDVLDDVVARGDALVRDIHAADPEASPVLWTGFDARLRALAEVVAQMASSPAEVDPSVLRAAVDRVRTHMGAAAPAGTPRAERAELAARLASWLAGPSGTLPTSLAAAAEGYLRDGAYVDWARRRVAEGDPDDAVAAALGAVGRAAEARRSAENRLFASLLSSWTEHGNPTDVGSVRIVPVEAALDAVVAPLARRMPILLVVLDGAGLAAFLELAPQLRSRGVVELGPDGARRAGLAVLPTVTEVSRTSLLAGRLLAGGQADEKRELAAHPTLVKLGEQPPVVFHKSDFAAGIGQPLPVAVRDAVGPGGPKVVAAVVNTIDEQLTKGDFAAAYRIEDLGPLDALLRLALDAGRAVVITADHGHVLGVGPDGKGAADRGGEGGDRWRVADRDPTEDEVVLRGPRVLKGDDGGILAPWHDVLRYSAKHGGYHGGATPDEVLVPLSVFLQAGVDAPPGWEPVVAPTPPWWDLAPAPAAVAAAPAKPKATKRPAPQEQGALFEPPAEVPEPVGPAWIDQLLGCELYEVQVGSVGRGAPKDGPVRAALAAMSERAGVASFATVAQATGAPLVRMPGFLASLARVLNVDGYPVLTVDASGSEVRLDEALLRTQFLETT